MYSSWLGVSTVFPSSFLSFLKDFRLRYHKLSTFYFARWLTVKRNYRDKIISLTYRQLKRRTDKAKLTQTDIITERKLLKQPIEKDTRALTLGLSFTRFTASTSLRPPCSDTWSLPFTSTHPRRKPLKLKPGENFTKTSLKLRTQLLTYQTTSAEVRRACCGALGFIYTLGFHGILGLMDFTRLTLVFPLVT